MHINNGIYSYTYTCRRTQLEAREDTRSVSYDSPQQNQLADDFKCVRIYTGCIYQYSLSRWCTFPSFETLTKVSDEAFSRVLIKPQHFLSVPTWRPRTTYLQVLIWWTGKKPAELLRADSTSFATMWLGTTHLTSLHCSLFPSRMEIMRVLTVWRKEQRHREHGHAAWRRLCPHLCSTSK